MVNIDFMSVWSTEYIIKNTENLIALKSAANMFWRLWTLEHYCCFGRESHCMVWVNLPIIITCQGTTAGNWLACVSKTWRTIFIIQYFSRLILNLYFSPHTSAGRCVKYGPCHSADNLKTFFRFFPFNTCFWPRPSSLIRLKMKEKSEMVCRSFFKLSEG